MKRIIYIATPINARTEATFELKLAAAKKRIGKLSEACRKVFPDCRVTSTFDINPEGIYTEEEAMGRCITLVLQSTTVLLDRGWEKSKGCTLESHAAVVYHKETITVDMLEEIINYVESQR